MTDPAFIERVAKAMRFDGSDATVAEREEIWAKLKNGTKEYWRDFVRLVLREIDAQGMARDSAETEGLRCLSTAKPGPKDAPNPSPSLKGTTP